MSENGQRRLLTKSLEGQLLWELTHEFELSPRESELLLDTVHSYYGQSPDSRAGRISLWVVERGSSVGKPLQDLTRLQVWVTLDGGQEDLEAFEKFGQIGLRRQRLLRMTEEVVDQGGIATQQDLSRLLGVSERTIKRDIAYLRGQGFQVLTRGYDSDIGPTISHKTIIVKLYLSGHVYTEICRKTRHSAKAVNRYVNTFGRVAALYGRGVVAVGEIAHYVGVSERLAREYLDLYFTFRADSAGAGRIADLVERLQSSSKAAYESTKKGVLTAEVNR